jgi:hypothetical protein
MKYIIMGHELEFGNMFRGRSITFPAIPAI